MIESRFVYPLFHYGFLDGAYMDQVSICCPFHDESKPSLTIDLEKETFYCFGCGERGTLTEFFMKLENMDFFQATKMISKLNKDKPLPTVEHYAKEKVSDKEALIRAYQYYDSYEQTDWQAENSEAATYMEKRGFDREFLTKMRLKIIHCDIYGVLVPFSDNGKFKGYVKRAIDEKKLPKYRYNTGLSRQNTLVGDYYKDWVIVTEGCMDWLKLRQFGVKNSVAILGWKITDVQISKLQQVTNKIVCALDSTESGDKGYEYLKQYFDVVRFQFPSDTKDIGDMNENQFRRSWSLTKKQIAQHRKKR